MKPLRLAAAIVVAMRCRNWNPPSRNAEVWVYKKDPAVKGSTSVDNSSNAPTRRRHRVDAWKKTIARDTCSISPLMLDICHQLLLMHFILDVEHGHNYRQPTPRSDVAPVE